MGALKNKPLSNGGITSVNPTTGQVWCRFTPHSKAEVERRLRLSTEAFHTWRRRPFEERAALMTALAEVLEADRNQLGLLASREMGKPIRAAVQEVEKCALVCRYYAANAARFLAEEPVSSQAARCSVRFQPLGIILAVMPWNFPYWQVFRFAAPVLMAGNVALLKHASNVPQCALAIEDAFARAGFPGGAFQTLLVPADRVRQVIADPRVSAVSVTGSLEAGAGVAGVAGRHVKKTILELGGSDPFIVMPSADLAQAIAIGAQARIINNGQSCIAAKRFIVDRRVADQFERGLVEKMASLKVGDPLDETTDVGPLATSDVLDTLQRQVDETVRLGARLLLGGKRLDGPGFFYPPTALADIPVNSPAYAEELFGPVALLFRVDGMEDAIRLANDSRFGLGAAAWTQDERERNLFIDEIQAGMAFVNGMVVSSPLLPFGGVKQSGYGRELGCCGIREFVNIKSVSIHGEIQSATKTL